MKIICSKSEKSLYIPSQGSLSLWKMVICQRSSWQWAAKLWLNTDPPLTKSSFLYPVVTHARSPHRPPASFHLLPKPNSYCLWSPKWVHILLTTWPPGKHQFYHMDFFAELGRSHCYLFHDMQKILKDIFRLLMNRMFWLSTLILSCIITVPSWKNNFLELFIAKNQQKPSGLFSWLKI